MLTLKDNRTRSEYASVLEALDKGSFWSKEWAERQYLGLVITAMCYSVIDDEHEARRYAMMRVLEVFLEHRHDLLPATDFDRLQPRSRIATLAIPNCEEQCKPWLDVLEYMQLMNWTRKGVCEDASRVEELRHAIEDQFSHQILAEIEIGPESWWIR
ncbi:MAG: hypothetical protein KAU31_00910 [Spirochaetaceae bacterium]|nr:hypothetical protein [Spirochaetaceae bacterium]